MGHPNINQYSTQYQGSMFALNGQNQGPYQGNFQQTGTFQPYGNYPPFFQPGTYYQPPGWNYFNPVVPGQQLPYHHPVGMNVTQPGFQQPGPNVGTGLPVERTCPTGPTPVQNRSSSTGQRTASRSTHKSVSAGKGRSGVKRLHTSPANVSRPGVPCDVPTGSTHTGRPSTVGQPSAVRTGSQVVPTVARKSKSQSHDAHKRHSTQASSDEESEDGLLPTSHSRDIGVDLDSVSVHAPSEDGELDSHESDAAAPQSVASDARSTRGEGDAEESQSYVEDTVEKTSDSYFRRCYGYIYETFGEECPPPPPPPRPESHVLSYVNPTEKQTEPRSLPNSLALKTAITKVQNEIAGNNANTLPLPIGKLPAASHLMRNKRYKTHDSLFTAGLPKLDADAGKVDNQAGSFKSVTIDRALLQVVGQSVNATVRTLSHLDWLVAQLVRIAESTDHPDQFLDLTRAVGNTLVHGLEFSVRSHAMLQLLERDAFLNRPSVQLTDELKARARVVPLDPKALFAGKLAEFAKEATQVLRWQENQRQ
ncbi:uncharacterized protein [Ptychodera flava]|uniref:uncharacterized protein isoform X1 n=1 Tax=Ptychodera flava TaxID=63121 RepID=UPI00396A5434